MKPFRDNVRLHLVLLVTAALAARILFLCSPLGQTLDPDEAVFGLMAQKIAGLEEFPIYMWENHYAGAPVSYLAAAVFRIFGSGPLQLRLPMLVLSVITPVLFYFIYRRLFDPPAAFIASLFLIFCPFVVFYHTSAARGGYGETLLGTALIILLSRSLQDGGSAERPSGLAFLLLGVLCGFFFYIFFLIVPAVLAFALPAVWHRRRDRLRNAAWFSGGSVIGASPFILYNLSTGGWSFLRAGSWALATGRSEIHQPLSSLLKQILVNKMNYFTSWAADAPSMFGLYILPGGAGKFILPLSGILVMMVLCFFLLHAFKNNRSYTRDQRPWAFFLVFLILFQWIAGLFRPRHLLPLATVLPVAFLSLAGSRPRMRHAVFAVLILLSLGNALDWNRHLRQGYFDPRSMAEVMKSNGIHTFYGTYHAVYPIMFASGGDLTGSPSLMRPGIRFFDPKPSYTLQVRRSDAPAFVFLKDEPGLLESFRRFLNDHGIRSRVAAANGHQVYFSLSAPVEIIIDKEGKSVFAMKGCGKDRGS